MRNPGCKLHNFYKQKSSLEKRSFFWEPWGSSYLSRKLIDEPDKYWEQEDGSTDGEPKGDSFAPRHFGVAHVGRVHVRAFLTEVKMSKGFALSYCGTGEFTHFRRKSNAMGLIKPSDEPTTPVIYQRKSGALISCGQVTCTHNMDMSDMMRDFSSSSDGLKDLCTALGCA